MAFPRVIFVLGGPGSGKGTQCHKICQASADFVHLSAGELLREARNSGSELGEMIEKCMLEGSIVPAEVTVNLLKQAMEKNGWGQKKFLIDGFPRNYDNYKTWFTMLPDLIVDFCLFLDCSDDAMVNRILHRGEGRTDDNIETLTRRLNTYRESTQPIANLFEQQGKLIKINADGDPESIFNLIKPPLGLN